MPRRAVWQGALALVAYAAVAVAASWPLPRHLSTHLTGTPGSDAGVYLWNTWVFRHEAVDHGRWPFSTETVLPLDGLTPLGLHNYTVAADVASLLLQPVLGLLTTFNVLYLASTVLAGFGMFLLARRVTRARGGTVGEAWLAGLLFAWSPFLVARSSVHFSLAAAAPLPLFVYFLDRMLTQRRMRDAVGCGLCFAWAGYSDAYYAIYCLMLAACLLAGRQLHLARRGRDPRHRRAIAALDVVMAALIVLPIGLRLSLGESFHVGGIAVSLGTLHTPLLAIAVLGIVRLLLTLRPAVSIEPSIPMGAVLRLGAVAGLVAAALLAPTLIEIAGMASEGALVRAPVPWRSSAPGLDLVSFLLPNPMHMGERPSVIAWLDAQPSGWAENVASLPWIAVGTVLVAWRYTRDRPDPLWMTITIGFLVLAMGPFLRVGGVGTPVPLPWAVLRYVPVIGDARMPTRFAVVAMIGVAVLFALALAALGRRYPARRRAITGAIGLALAVELLPAPRVLHEVRIPEVYRVIAADLRPVRVLDLPFGISDGLVSSGAFSAASLVFQTVHEKPLIGGYLSRVPPPTRQYHLDQPLLSALAEFSEGRTPSPDRLAAAEQTAAALLRTARIGYVVIDTSRASPALQDFAIRAMRLTLAGTSEQFQLYQPASGDRAVGGR